MLEITITFRKNLKQIRTKSISEDVVFAATGELKKPQNHLMLGLLLEV